ncbi:CPA1 plasma membrane transporter [Ecytonucleospora hepatopenaei]|uniref:CPA1 plasma membrane transporter n=1 Tax=Ecytonucleospora hepatopenaei TaxID=646526 RepID=A0A1W0E3J4_9MICR|nr:CPA1 plasma membrane transporter [Ecytonucleospora hepatopenaei]
MEDIIKLICSSSLFILVYSMIAKYVKNKFHIPDPFVTLIFGILIGHHFLNILNTHYIYSKVIVLNFSKIVLCLQTMAISLKIRKAYLTENFKMLFNLIILAGIVKCMFVFILIYCFTYFEGATSWALAASLTPTDPILSSSIISGRFARINVSERLRDILVVESGINDGIGILLLNISLLILVKTDKVDKVMSQKHFFKKLFTSKLFEAVKEFLIDTFILKIFVSAIIGAVLGKITKIFSKKCYKAQLLSSEILLIHSFALTFLDMAIMTMIDGSELICIFFSGIFLNEDGWYTSEINNKISDVIENSFFMALFVFLGSRIDFNRFNSRMFVIIFTVIFLRIFVVLLLYKPLLRKQIRNYKEALFIGFFGPIGVGAIYYSLLYDIKIDALTVDYAMCSVFVSVILHGLAVPVYCASRKIMLKIREAQF